MTAAPGSESKESVDLARMLGERGLPAEDARDRLVGYLNLLRRWNTRINLTATTDWPSLRPMFSEAVWAAARYPDRPVRHLDIGSGAGFPALLMRILRSGMELDLVESRVKRAVFLETVVAELQLTGVRVHARRLSSVLREAAASWDFISWKGLRLEPADLRLLANAAVAETRIWVFHGEGGGLPSGFERECRAGIPSRSHSYLSVYRVSERERFT